MVVVAWTIPLWIGTSEQSQTISLQQGSGGSLKHAYHTATRLEFNQILDLLKSAMYVPSLSLAYNRISTASLYHDNIGLLLRHRGPVTWLRITISRGWRTVSSARRRRAVSCTRGWRTVSRWGRWTTVCRRRLKSIVVHYCTCIHLWFVTRVWTKVFYKFIKSLYIWFLKYFLYEYF